MTKLLSIIPLLALVSCTDAATGPVVRERIVVQKQIVYVFTDDEDKLLDQIDWRQECAYRL